MKTGFLRLKLLFSQFIKAIAVSTFIVGIFLPQNSFPLPQGGQVVGGQSHINKPTPNSMIIRQTTPKSIINWKSYNVGGKERVHYQQPNRGSISLNRINPNSGVSKIYGMITANGQVWLLNPAGIWFGPNAYVDVAGLIATTAGISNQDFMAGRYRFVQDPSWHGSIINEGTIIVRAAGLAALVGSAAVNAGKIEANLGTVVLASGTEYTVDFIGDGRIHFAIGKAADYGVDQNGKRLSSAVQNSGMISANGGKILMSAQGASKILDNSINMSGYVEAKSVGARNGEIIFDAGQGKLQISGKVVASGKNKGEKGGSVKALGEKIIILSGSSFDISGYSGGGEILIGGNAHGMGPEKNAVSTYVGKNVNINADALVSGSGGKVVVWSDKSTQFYGNISARGGQLGGDGGWVETSGRDYLDVNGAQVNTLANKGLTGTWLLDPTNIWIALNQTNATAAGMLGTDSSANIGNGTSANNFNAFGAVSDSLLTTGNLQTALASSNVIVSTTNTPGTGAGNITLVDPLSWSSANSLTLTAANNIAINAAVTTGTLASALILNAAGTVIQTAVIGGSGGVTQQGAGTVILSQANTYTGATNVNSGVVTVQNNTALGTNAGATSVASGAAIQIDGSGLSINEPITLIGSGVNSGGALRNLANANTWSGAITLGSGGAQINSDSSTLTLTGGITGAAQPLTIGGSGNVTINSVIGTTTGTLTKTGVGVLTFGGVNTYSGATTINQGTLLISGSGTALNTAFTVNEDANLTLNNLGTNLNDRIANTLTLNGGEFIFKGSGSGASSESVGQLALASGDSTVTVNAGAGGSTTLTFASINRSTGATVLFRGDSLGGTAGANVANIIFTTATGLGLVGGNTTQVNKPIVPFAIGDTSAIGSGIGFVTYNINPASNAANTTGIRPLDLGTEYTTSSATAGVNLNVTSATAGLTGNRAFNSLLFSGGVSYTMDNGSNRDLTNTSGAIFSDANNNTLTGRTGDKLVLGSVEGKVFVMSGGTFTHSSTQFTGSAGVTKAGLGTYQEDVATTFNGGIRINSGTVLSGINSAFTSQALSISAPGTLNLNGFNNTFSSLTLESGANAGSTITTGAGILTLAGNTTLNVNGSGATGATISGNLAISGSTRTFTVNDGLAATDLGISAVISGVGFGITKAGSGLLALTGANTYTGITTINAGTLSANTLTSGGVASSIGQATASATNLVLGNGTLQYTGATTSINRAFTLTAATTNVFDITDAGTNLTISGVGASTTGALTKSGSGTLTLSGLNLFTGGTTVNAGTLALGTSGALLSSSLNVNGGTFALGTFNNTISAVTLTNGSITGSTGVLTSSSFGVQNGTISAILGGAGGLTKTTSGTVTLSGLNTYTGATTVNAGVLSVNSIANGGSASAIGQSTNAAANLVLGGGTLQYTGNTVSTNRNFTLTAATTSGIDVTNSAANLTISGASTATSGALTKLGTGTLTLSGANTYTGATLVNSGTLAEGVNNALGNTALTVNGGTFDIGTFTDTVGAVTLSNGTIAGISGVLTGTAFTLESGLVSATLDGSGVAINKNTTGDVTISGTVLASGAKNINAGKLIVTNASGLGTNSINVSNNAVLDLNFNSATLGNTSTITLNGTGAGSGALTFSGSNIVLSNPISLASDSSIGGTGGGNITFNTINGANNLTVNLANATAIFGSAIGGTAPLSSLTINSNALSLSNVRTTGLQSYTASSGTLGLNGSYITSGGTFTATGATLLNGTTSVDTTNAGVKPAGASITFNSTINNANSFTLTAGTGGAINLNSAVGNLGALTSLTASGNTISLNNVKTTGAQNYTGITSTTLNGNYLTSGGTFDITGPTLLAGTTMVDTTNNGGTPAGANINFTNTINNNQALTIKGGTNGAIGFGGAIGDTAALSSLAIVNGNSISAKNVKTVGAQSYTANSINFNGDYITSGGTVDVIGPLTLGGNVSIDTTNAGVTAAGASISLNSVSSATNPLTLNSGTSGTISGSSFSGNGNLTISNSAGTSFSGAVNAGTVTLSDSTNNIIFNGALNATTLTTAVKGYGVQVNNGGSITNAVTFSNTGALVLGNAASDNLAFVGGVTATSPSSISLAGTVSASGTGIINLNTPITVTDDSTIGGSSTGQITLGSTIIADNKTLNVGTGANSPITLGAVNGDATAGTSSLVVNSGNSSLSFNGVIGAVRRLEDVTATTAGVTNDLVIANNINTTGNITLTAGRHVTLSTGNLNSTTGSISLTGTAGLVQQTGTSTISGGLLTTNSVGGTTLNNNNTISSFNATNSTSGLISLVNSAAPLTITGISQSGGNTTISNTGGITLNGAINNGTGAVSLISTGELILNNGSSITTNVAGNAIVLAGSVFTNDAGASVFNPGVGRFLVWSSNPANDDRGDVVYNFKQYDANYGSSTVLGSGNGFLYSIAPTITPSLINSVSKVYNGTTVATLNAGNYSNSGAINDDVVTLNNPTTGAYDNKNAGINKNVSVTGIDIANAMDGTANVYGYTLSSTTANANIGEIIPASLLINPDVGQSKVYGANDPLSGFAYSTVGLISGDSITGALGRAAGENFGTYAFNLGNLAPNIPGNYDTSLSAGTFAITKAALTITPTASQSKVYGTNDPAGGFTYNQSGLVNSVTPKYWNSSGDYVDAAQINDTISGNLGRAANENVGNYAFNLGNLAPSNAGNYNTNIAAVNFSIIQAPLVITATSGQNKVYSTDDPVAGFTYGQTGLVNGVTPKFWNSSGSYVDAAQINDTLSGKLGRAANENVGNHAFNLGSVTPSNAGNYNTSLTADSFAITPASLVITANSGQNKVYGTDDPAAGFTYGQTGLVSGVTPKFWNSSGNYVDAAEINDTLSGKLGRAANENVGSHAFNLGNLAPNIPGNYNTSLTSGSFAIIQAALVITANSGQSKIYGADDLISGFTYGQTGLVNGVTPKFWNSSGNYVDASQINDTISGNLGRAAGENVGSYAFNLGSAAPSNPSNYNTSLTVGTFSISKAALVVTADSGQSKIYGQSDPVSGFTYNESGLVTGVTPKYWNAAGAYIDANEINDTISGNLGRAANENVGSYAFNLGSVTPSNAGNYNTSLTADSFSITPASLVITANPGQNKVYGTDDPIAGFAYGQSGLVNGVTPKFWNSSGNYVDVAEINDTLSGKLGRAANENVGSHAFNLGSVAPSNAGNYNTSLTSGNFAITLASLIITPNSGQNKVYGTDDPAAGFTYGQSGLVNGVTPKFWDSSGSYVDAAQINDTISGNLGRAANESVGNQAFNLGSLSPSNAGNYNTSLTADSFAITPASLVITANSGQSKAYGTDDPVSGFSYTNTGIVNGVTPKYWSALGNYVDATTINDTLTGRLGRTAGENVGNYSYNIGNIAASTPNNYAMSLTANNFTVTPASLVVTANASQSKVYGTDDPVSGFAYSQTGLVNGVTPKFWNASGNYVNGTMINDTMSGNLGRVAGENVGNYAFGQGAVAANTPANYLMTFNSNQFIITKAALSINVSAGQSKVYGTNDPASGLSYSHIGLVNGIAPKYWNNAGAYVNASTINDTISGNLGRSAGENVGNYNVSIGTLAVNTPVNYNTTFTANNFNIAPASLVITANSGQSKVYGTSDPATYIYEQTGLVNGVTPKYWNSSGNYVNAATIHNSINGNLARAPGENVGNYVYGIGSVAPSTPANYQMTLTPGSFAITSAAANISNVSALSKVFNSSDNAMLNLANAILSGLLPGDVVNVMPNNYSARFVTAKIGNNIPVIVLSIGLNGASAGNYTLIMPVGLTANITAPPSVNNVPPGAVLPTNYESDYDSLNGLQPTEQKTLYGFIKNAPATPQAPRQTSASCISVGSNVEICSFK